MEGIALATEKVVGGATDHPRRQFVTSAPDDVHVIKKLYDTKKVAKIINLIHTPSPELVSY